MVIQNHPIACHWPMQTDSSSPQSISDSDDFKSFVTRHKFPTFEQMVQQSLPMISLHISSFQDATIVSLVWPHALMDAFGGQALLSAWSSVLNSQEENLYPVYGAKNDLLRDAIFSNPESHEELKLEKRRLSGMGLYMFLFRHIWNSIWGASRQRRLICLSKDTLQEIKRRAQEEISESQDHNPDMRISSGDALTAWISQTVALSEPTIRPITILSLLNVRFRLPQFINSTGVFLQNLTLGTFSFISSSEVKGTIGSIALSHRQHFTEQATAEQVSAFLRSGYKALDAGQTPGVLFGESDALPIIFNNMEKAELIKTVDFSAAVKDQGDFSEDRMNPVGSMVNYYYENVGQPYKGFNLFTMLGQDHAGNHWLEGTLLPRAWTKIEEELKKIEESP